LSHFAFPGNVRQLENICHWLTVMAPSLVIEPKDLPPEVLAVTEQSHSLRTSASPAATAESLEAAATALGLPVGEDSVPLRQPLLADEWDLDMAEKARGLLEAGHTDVWDAMTRQFESRLILAALAHTKGRRIEAAHKLGIGRNTITRKIQELGLE
jgi:two-component system nitrogen regulation response regulator GlnG